MTMLPLPPAEIRHASRVSRFGQRRDRMREPYEGQQDRAQRSGLLTDLVASSNSTCHPFVSSPYGDIISSTRLRFSRASPVGSVMPCPPCLAPWSGVYVAWHDKICRSIGHEQGQETKGPRKLTTYRVLCMVARLAA